MKNFTMIVTVFLFCPILFYFSLLQYVGDEDVIIINNFTSIIITVFHFVLRIVTSHPPI